ncbi:MAG: hypothetical protein AAGA80_20795, partial [Cyanobacteria bacterium P01_F01_bin.143]
KDKLNYYYLLIKEKSISFIFFDFYINQECFYMKMLFYKNQILIQFLGLIINSIRGLAQMPETPIFLLNPVDALWSKGFDDFSFDLLQNIINYLRGWNYPAKNRCRILARSRNWRVLLPIS